MTTSERLTIQVSPQAQSMIHELSIKTALPTGEVVARALDELRRRLLFEEANAALVTLQLQPEGWQKIKLEDAAWDVALADGLEPEDWSEYELK